MPSTARTGSSTVPQMSGVGRRRVALETRVNSLREERGRLFRPALLMLAAATGWCS